MEYNRETKIGEEYLVLDNQRQAAVTKFHKNRLMFTFLEDGTVATSVNDKREHKVWLQEEYGIDEERFQNLVRGYAVHGRIVFYKSLNFSEIDEDLMPYIQVVGGPAVQFCGSSVFEIWNGVKIGNPGEEWKPASIPYKVKITLSFSHRRQQLDVVKIS